jgi:hypothetical protein
VTKTIPTERPAAIEMASRIEMILPAIKNTLWNLVEMLENTPNKKGIIAKMTISTSFAIVMNNAYVGSIIFPFRINPVSCPDKFLRGL